MSAATAHIKALARPNKKGVNEMEYMDVMQVLSRTYFEALLANDQHAVQATRNAAVEMGLPPEAGETIAQENGKLPLSQWLSQGSVAS